MSDLVIRHVPADRDKARQLEKALETFGYAVACCEKAIPDDGEHTILALWSSTSIADDGYIEELARHVRSATIQSKTSRVHEARVEPLLANVRLLGHWGRGAPDRLIFGVDLSGWDGAPSDDILAPLIWELPLPAAPSKNPPLMRAESRDEAEWLGLKARRDIAAIAKFLRLKIAPSRSREDALVQRERLEAMRAIGLDPESWRGFGPMTVEAVANGANALRAWGDLVAKEGLIPDLASHGTITRYANLLFAIDVCVGTTEKHAFKLDLRSPQEVLAQIEEGDVATMISIAYDPEFSRAAKPALERLARNGNAAAMLALSRSPDTPDYRRRVLLEKAASLGDTLALLLLGWQLQARRKHKKAIEVFRRGAELGDVDCQRELACALDAGKYVRRDAASAYRLYQLALRRPDRDNQIALRVAQMLWDGDGVARDRERALHAFFDLHIGDEAPYQVAVHVGDFYRDGLGGLVQDREEAVALYQGAAHNGDSAGIVAMRRLAEMEALSEDDDDSEILDDDHLEPEELEEVRHFWRPTS